MGGGMEDGCVVLTAEGKAVKWRVGAPKPVAELAAGVVALAPSGGGKALACTAQGDVLVLG